MMTLTRRTLGALSCATALALGAGTASSQEATITGETVAPGSAVHYIDTTFAAILDAEGVASVQMTEGATLTNSVQAIAEERLDLSTAPLILHFLLSRGIGPYAGVGKEKGAELADNIRALYFYASSHQLMGHYNASKVQGFDDLKGKRIWNGPPRGAALTDGRTFIELTTGLKDGEGYEGVQTPWGETVPTISGGAVDAFTLPESLPSGRINQILAAGGVTLYDIPSDIMNSDIGKKVMAAPGHALFSVPVDEYKAAYEGSDVTVVTDDGTFDTYSIAFAPIVPASMDEELAYKMTKAFLDNEDRMKSGAPFARYAGLTYGDLDGTSQGACGLVQIKMHPGAIRAFEEAGHKVADCLKP
jgi:hypothetical protein